MDNNVENNNIQRIENDNNIQLSDLWAMFINHKILYVLSLFICLSIAALYLYVTPKQWNRNAKIIIDESSENSTMRELAAFTSQTGGMSKIGSGSNVLNEIEAFASPDLMQEVISRLNYQTTYIEKQFLRKRELFDVSPFVMIKAGDNPKTSFSFNVKKTGDNTFIVKNFVIGKKKLKSEHITGALGDTVTTPAGKIILKPTVNIEKWDNPIIVKWVNSADLAKDYSLRLSVNLARKQTSVLNLSFQDEFPHRAERIIETLIVVYNDEWINEKSKAARNTTAFINDRLNIIEKELGGVEGNLKNYKEKNRITNIESVSDTYLKESSEYATKSFELNNQLSIAKYIRDYLTDPNHLRDLIPSNSGVSSESIEKYIKEYNDLLLKRDRLLAASSNDNPMIIDMNQTLEAIKVSIMRSIDNLISTLQLQYDKFVAQENAIIGRIANASGQELQLLSIERQQKVKEQLYIYLLQKREENEISALVNVGNTRLIMNPNGSKYPDSPKLQLVLLLAFAFGLGMPFAYFFIRETLNTTVKSRQDLTRLSVPFLSEIPQIGVSGNFWQRLINDKFNNENCNILVENGKRDAINEAFRVLRTNLDTMTSSQNGAHVIMVTSFNPNAGKTFTIMNMAASVALKGVKVLLLDLDLRKATLSKALAKNSTGVGAYLTGKINDYKATLQNIKENLSLLSVGTLPPNPAELLVSQRFKDFVNNLRGDFDYIFIDCPPIDVVADTAIIADVADMTIFIMRAGLVDKRSLPLVEDIYKKGTYHRVAIVLNGVEQSQRGYGHYGYGYGGGYGYGYGNEN